MSEKFTNPIPKEIFAEVVSQHLLEEKPEEKPKERNRWFNEKTEILDMDGGWIYERLKRGRRGKKIRKFLVSLYGYSGRDNGIYYWKPRLDDLAACERSRWNAVQYAENQFAKITGAFDLVLKNTPFCCVKSCKEWPGFSWVVFPHYDQYERGVSWSHWRPEDEIRRNPRATPSDRPPYPLKQDVGDAWFNYEARSRQIRERWGYFDHLFQMSIEKKYSDIFYRDRYSRTKINLVINGRNYLIGKDDRGQFGIIAKPEETQIVVVE